MAWGNECAGRPQPGPDRFAPLSTRPSNDKPIESLSDKSILTCTTSAPSPVYQSPQQRPAAPKKRNSPRRFAPLELLLSKKENEEKARRAAAPTHSARLKRRPKSRSNSASIPAPAQPQSPRLQRCSKPYSQRRLKSTVLQAYTCRDLSHHEECTQPTALSVVRLTRGSWKLGSPRDWNSTHKRSERKPSKRRKHSPPYKSSRPAPDGNSASILRN